MPKHYRELSQRQQRRRLHAFRKNEQLQENLQSSSMESQETCATQSTQEIAIPEIAANTSIVENILSPNNSPRQSDTSSEELVIDGDHDRIINGENLHGNKQAENMSLSEWLCSWAMQYNISQNALKPLLRNLYERGHCDLPCDARTLLNTPRQSSIQPCSAGSYFHYGLQKALIDQLKKNKITFDSNVIMIDVNIDGLPLSKSSKSQFWPILGKIYHKAFDEPFVIGAYHGISKPHSVSEFLTAFIDEYQSLHNDGFNFDNKHYTVTIRCIICDTPARAYVSCVKAHNAYFGCGKCMQEGDWNNHRMLFLESNARLRTDENFRNRDQEEHHTGYSPFETSIGMISQLPNDPLHLMWLGVCKQWLSLSLHGRHSGRFNAAKLQELSRRLTEISVWIPKEFARKPRGIDELKRWKGTEFRLFALYIGPIVLNGLLPRANLMHFNTFNCAARILSHPLDCNINNEYAHELLVYFVESCKTLYGEDVITYNMHNLVHIHDDVKKFGPLDDFSAWPFENHMQILKKLLRKNERPLAQLHNRLTEKSYLSQRNERKRSAIPVLRKRIVKALPLNCTDAHKHIEFEHFELTDKRPNNCCILEDKSIITIDCIGYKNEVPIIIGRKFTSQVPLPTYPCNSTDLDMYVASGFSELKIWNVGNIANKTLSLPFQDQWYIIPLLHPGMK